MAEKLLEQYKNGTNYLGDGESSNNGDIQEKIRQPFSNYSCYKCSILPQASGIKIHVVDTSL